MIITETEYDRIARRLTSDALDAFHDAIDEIIPDDLDID
jgi:hypothetical protein